MKKLLPIPVFLLLGSAGCEDSSDTSNNTSNSVRSWKGNFTYVSSGEVLGVSARELATAEVSLELDEAAGMGTSLMIFRPVGTWTYSRTAASEGCTFTTQPAEGSLNKLPEQGVMILHDDGDESSVPYEALIGTGEFESTTSVVCDAVNYTEIGPDAHNLLVVRLDQELSVSADGNTIEGSHTEGTSADSRTYQWSLSACESPQMCESPDARGVNSYCSLVALITIAGCLRQGHSHARCGLEGTADYWKCVAMN